MFSGENDFLRGQEIIVFCKNCDCPCCFEGKEGAKGQEEKAWINVSMSNICIKIPR